MKNWTRSPSRCPKQSANTQPLGTIYIYIHQDTFQAFISIYVLFQNVNCIHIDIWYASGMCVYKFVEGSLGFVSILSGIGD